jgi:membrane protease subunit HflK
MAWNETTENGSNPKTKNNQVAKQRNQGPPDLEELIQGFSRKISKFLRNNRKNGNSFLDEKLPRGLGTGTALLILVAITFVILVWGLLGLYTVDQQQQAVILRLGKYHDIVNPGLHWNPPLIDEVSKINVTRVRTHSHRALMLTEDENIVEIALTIQYIVSDPKKFLLEVRKPEASLANATESALRHVVGGSKMYSVLTQGRALLASNVQMRLQQYLDSYTIGLEVSKVNIENTQAPSQVQDAFDDVIKAREDEQRVKNEAQAYANSIVPEARGKAKRVLEESNAYREDVVARAQGESMRFSKLLAEYNKAPEVTRERLYLVAMEDVLSSVSKVLVDVKGGNNMMVLPLEHIMKKPTPLKFNNLSSEDEITEIKNRVLKELEQRKDNMINRGGR